MKQKDISYINILNDIYPKFRPQLNNNIKNIFKKEYKLNRENKLTRIVESWMHRAIHRVNRRNINVLEIGAGTLNHVAYELPYSKSNYDIVEPKKYLYKNSKFKKFIKNFYFSYKEVPDDHYDIINSCATLEHLENLPEFLAMSAFKIKEGGVQSHSIPCEDYFTWKLFNRYINGIIFKIRTGENWNNFMSHEHLNNYNEITGLIKFFYKNVKIKFSYPFFYSPHTSFYANIFFSGPKKKLCKRFLFLNRRKKLKTN
jgi:2-polyprenyl-3-methyl-5-hydroxy-6-metoxy-1,4-benzoquinol methylase